MDYLTSAATTYGLGMFAFLFSQDLTTYAAFAGLLLVLVRIAGDIPKAYTAWRNLFKGDEDDSTTE